MNAGRPGCPPTLALSSFGASQEATSTKPVGGAGQELAARLGLDSDGLEKERCGGLCAVQRVFEAARRFPAGLPLSLSSLRFFRYSISE